MKFFSDIGKSISRGFTSVTKGIGGGLTKVKDTVLKPVYSQVIKPTYTEVIKSAYTEVIKPVAQGVDKVAERVGDAALKVVDGVGGIAGFLGNPIVLIGGLVVGGIVLTKVLNFYFIFQGKM